MNNHGVILLNKDKDISSFKALSAVKKLFRKTKVGHTGTLDPFAEGLMVVLVGKLTRLAPLFSEMDKTYNATFTFGIETDTLDTEGETIATASPPSKELILEKLDSFRGVIEQIPPRYSAIKVNGKRLYKLAREGKEEIEIPKRSITVNRFDLESWGEVVDKNNLPIINATFTINCSSGTYIRSLARDLALSTGSRGYVSSLKRTTVGPFSLSNSVIASSLTEENLIFPQELPSYLSHFFLLPLKNILPIGDLSLWEERISHGNMLPLENILPLLKNEGFYFIMGESENALAILQYEKDRLPKYRVVFD